MLFCKQKRNKYCIQQAILTSDHTMIQVIMISFLTASGSSYNLLVPAFNDNKHTTKDVLTGNNHCQPVIGNAWKCWSKFGNHYICSDINRQAWQCHLAKYRRRMAKPNRERPGREQESGKHLMKSLLINRHHVPGHGHGHKKQERNTSSSTSSSTTSSTTTTSATTRDMPAGNEMEEKGQEYDNWLQPALSNSRGATTTCQNNDDCGTGKTCSPEPASACCGNGSPIFYFNFFRHIQTEKGVLLFRVPCPCSLKIISNSASARLKCKKYNLK